MIVDDHNEFSGVSGEPMPRKTERRHRQGDESRQRILEAALAIAVERGYAGTSIALVTERTGLPASSVYWHFQNKDHLLAEALEHSFRQWRATVPLWSRELEPGDQRTRIRRQMRWGAAALAESPGFWRLGLMLALEQRVVEPAARRRFLEVRRETQEAISRWWEQILPAEAMVRDPTLTSRLARYHLAVIDGLYVGLQTGRGWDREALVDLIAAGLDAFAVRVTAAAS